MGLRRDLSGLGVNAGRGAFLEKRDFESVCGGVSGTRPLVCGAPFCATRSRGSFG